jgi:hypothetical protein
VYYRRKKKPLLSRISADEFILMQRIAGYMTAHPMCKTDEITGYFSEYNESLIKTLLVKMVEGGYIRFRHES